MQKVSFRWVPTALVVALVAGTLFGQDGLLAMWGLERDTTATRDAWGRIERDNSRRLLSLHHLQRDPLHLERLVAEELHWVPDDATLYVFEEPSAGAK